MQEPQISLNIVNSSNAIPLKVLVYDKDPAERWLIGTYLSQQTEKSIIAQETDQISKIKTAVDRGEIDLVVMGIDNLDELRYWLEEIVENKLAPVVALSEQVLFDSAEMALDNGCITFLDKNRLSRDGLIQCVDSTLNRWQAVKRSLAHKVELEKLANFDQMTGLFNRRAVLKRLEECIANSRRYQTEVSLLLIDLDHFEKYSEIFGRLAAEAIVNRIASLIEHRTRDTDFVGRYGRDEFLVVLPHTGLDAAGIAAERLRKAIESLEIEKHPEFPYNITVSGGLATYEPGDDVSTFTYRAESALCKAKEHGRNRIDK